MSCVTFSPSLGYTWIFVGLKEAIVVTGKPLTPEKTKLQMDTITHRFHLKLMCVKKKAANHFHGAFFFSFYVDKHTKRQKIQDLRPLFSELTLR